METIDQILDILLKKYKYSQRFNISLKYYIEAKIKLMLKNKIIADYQEKYILKMLIENFCFNVDSVVEKGESKYTFVEYELDRKRIIYYVGKDANLDKNCIDVKENVRTTQYMYKFFSVLEFVTNYNIAEIDKKYLKIYKMINSNLAYKYLNSAPKLEKAKLYFRSSNIFYDIYSFNSVINISKNYMDILIEYIIGYKNIYNIFINRRLSIMFDEPNYKRIFEYLLFIYDEIDYENFISLNEKIIELILVSFIDNINSLAPLKVYDKIYFRDALENIEKKLPSTIKDGKRDCIAKEKIKSVKAKIEM